MSPTFAELAPRPPSQNGFQAVMQGYDAAQANQLRGLQIATEQQQQQQAAQLFPSRLQQQQAIAQQQQIAVQQAQMQQRDANILSSAQRTVLGSIQQQQDPNSSSAPAGAAPVSDAPGKSSDGTTTGTAEAEDDEPTGEEDLDEEQKPASSAPAGPAPSTLVHPAVTRATPGIAPIMDGGDIYGQMLSEATKNGLSPQGQMKFAQQIMAQKESFAKYKTEDLKEKAEQYDQVAGRLDAFAKQPDDYKAQHWTDLLDGMTRDGLISPKEQQADLQQFPQYPGDQMATYLGTSHLAESQLMKRTLDEQDIASKKAQQSASTAEQANRQAEQPGLQAKSTSQEIEAWAQQLGSARDQASYDGVRAEMPKKYADQLPDDFDAKTTPALIDRWGQTAQQRVASDAVAQRNAQTTAHEKVTEQQGAQRVAIAQQRVGNINPRPGGMTPAQWQHQADSLATEGRGYVATRAQLRTALTQGFVPSRSGAPVTDTTGKPVPMSGAQRQAYQNQLDSVTGNLQNLQFRTAQFLKIPQPPTSAFSNLKDGDEVHSPDGQHIWKMQDGVVYPIK
jgi:hypothetical protein